MDEELGIYVALTNRLNSVAELIDLYGEHITLEELYNYLIDKKRKFKDIIVKQN